jgi:hypothetical protein
MRWLDFLAAWVSNMCVGTCSVSTMFVNSTCLRYRSLCPSGVVTEWCCRKDCSSCCAACSCQNNSNAPAWQFGCGHHHAWCNYFQVSKSRAHTFLFSQHPPLHPHLQLLNVWLRQRCCKCWRCGQYCCCTPAQAMQQPISPADKAGV